MYLKKGGLKRTFCPLTIDTTQCLQILWIMWCFHVTLLCHLKDVIYVDRRCEVVFIFFSFYVVRIFLPRKSNSDEECWDLDVGMGTWITNFKMKTKCLRCSSGSGVITCHKQYWSEFKTCQHFLCLC